MELTQEQMKELKTTGMFDFITNNAHKLDKADIVYLFREFAYAVYDVDKDVEKEAVEKTIEQIEMDMED